MKAPRTMSIFFFDASYAHFNNQPYRLKNGIPTAGGNFINPELDNRVSRDLSQVAGEIGYMFLISPNIELGMVPNSKRRIWIRLPCPQTK